MKQFMYNVSEFGKRIVLTFTPFLVYYVAVLILLAPPMSDLLSDFNEQRIKTAITKKILVKYCSDKKMAELFIKVGRLYDIDPFFLCSVVSANSNFEVNKITEGEDGAKFLGLMQINAADYSKYQQKNLFDLEINLKLGAMELRRAMDYGKGNMIKTLAVYYSDSVDLPNTKKYGQSTLDFIEHVRKFYSDIQRTQKLYIQENYDLFYGEK
ncbi:MAG: transglycosylase SLT domain-containing protein [Spirochaetales bacterium]|nr:transglycosylase SLT domain-containing protein [Spirochaetales bacterium]